MYSLVIGSEVSLLKEDKKLPWIYGKTAHTFSQQSFRGFTGKAHGKGLSDYFWLNRRFRELDKQGAQ
ncbi:hypothetical protein Lepto7375DRAFT_3148 [Leptolyngbya sp. PCC 7375]|nr:hypothetical protein Lepto7375DRAFT_3148 [Leptolyngbya sp. PCC 7375]